MKSQQHSGQENHVKGWHIMDRLSGYWACVWTLLCRVSNVGSLYVQYIENEDESYKETDNSGQLTKLD